MTERDERRPARGRCRTLAPDEPVDLDRSGAGRPSGGGTAGRWPVSRWSWCCWPAVVGLPRLLAGAAAQPSQRGRWRGGRVGVRAEADAGGPPPSAEAGPPGRQAAPTPTEAAPDGWRTEYYRDISFQVPDELGVRRAAAVRLVCRRAAEVDAEGGPAPTVRLAGHDHPVRAIGCPARPASLLTEHVEALAPGPAVDYVEGAVRQGEWWVVTRFAGSAVLVVTTKERAPGRADPGLGPRSRRDDAPCPPSSPIAGPLGARPGRRHRPEPAGTGRRVVLCQYEPVARPGRRRAAPAAGGRTTLAGGVSALVTELAAAPVNDGTCDPPPSISDPTSRCWFGSGSDGVTHDVYVNPAGCPDGERDGRAASTTEPRCGC